jgi:MFS transporter, PHS family, inorganic phosphate transporter
VITPAWEYTYWESSNSGTRGFTIDITTLAAILCGQLVFGHLADRWGRQKIYGQVLIMLIVGTLSIAQASTGYNNSMDIYGWLIFWRIILGLAIGGEYSISAIVAAEWSAEDHRGTLMALTFLAQSLGQLIAYAVSYGVLKSINQNRNFGADSMNHETAAQVIDVVWRCVIGVGTFPAFLSAFLRLSILESPRWILDTRKDTNKADSNLTLVLGEESQATKAKKDGDSDMDGSDSEVDNTDAPRDSVTNLRQPTATPANLSSPVETHPLPGSSAINVETAEGNIRPTASGVAGAATKAVENSVQSDGKLTTPNVGKKKRQSRQNSPQFNKKELHDYLIVQGAWKRLVAISLCWLLLDVCFYGLGLENPRTISRISKNNKFSTPSNPDDWDTELTQPNPTIYQVLTNNSVLSMRIISTGAVCGSLAIVGVINFAHRGKFMALIFLLLATVFLIAGGSLFASTVYQAKSHNLTVACYSIAQFLFNLGPNTLTYIMAAELFQTPYRGTFFGVAAAAGKLGAIIIQIAMKYGGLYKPEVPDGKLGGLLCSFSAIMSAASVVSWFYLPDVQKLKTSKSPSAADGEDGGKGAMVSRKREIRIFGRYKNLDLEKIAEQPEKPRDNKGKENAK